jgi:hypothetical protein
LTFFTVRRFAPLEARDDKGMLLENLVVASVMKRNLYGRRPYNAYFWRIYQGYEIDLVLVSSQNQELLAFQITSGKKPLFRMPLTPTSRQGLSSSHPITPTAFAGKEKPHDPTMDHERSSMVHRPLLSGGALQFL